MKIKLQKRNHSSLRRLTKVDENNQIIEGQELYVRVEDVPSNLVNSDATPLSDEVFDNINWKDNNALLFKPATKLPEPVLGMTQIVSLDNGQIWCVPGSDVTPFEIGGSGVTSYLTKNFKGNENVTILASNTKIGALPYSGNDETIATYLDISSGNIVVKINGTPKHILDDSKVSFTHRNNEICMKDSEVSLNYDSNNQIIGLIDGRLYIRGNGTQIIEDLNQNKLNCYTELGRAVYGNNVIHLEFNSDQVKFLNRNTEILTVRPNGSIYAQGPIYANGSNRVIDTSVINDYIETYFDNNFKNRFLECLENVLPSREVIETGTTQYYNFSISGIPSLYRIDFSDTSSGEIMTMYLRGDKINNLGREYRPETGYYYQVNQYEATDDSDEDSISITKFNSSGVGCGLVWLRGMYVYRGI